MRNYILKNQCVNRYLYQNVFKDQFYDEYEREIRRFELDMDHCERCMVAYHHKFLSRRTSVEIRNVNCYEKADYSIIFSDTSSKPESIEKHKQELLLLKFMGGSLRIPKLKSSYLVAKAKKHWLRKHSQHLALKKLNDTGYIRSNIYNTLQYRLSSDCNLLIFGTTCTNHWATLFSSNQNVSNQNVTFHTKTLLMVQWDGLPF
eukprot:307325_1